MINRKYKRELLTGHTQLLMFTGPSIYDDIALVLWNCNPDGYIIETKDDIVNFDFVESIDDSIVWNRIY